MDINTVYASMIKNAAPFTQVDASKQLGPISIEPPAAPAGAPGAPGAPWAATAPAKAPPTEEQLQEDALNVIRQGVTAAKGVIDRNKPQEQVAAENGGMPPAGAPAGIPPEAGMPVEGQMLAAAGAGLNPKDPKFCAGLSLLARLVP